MDENKPENEKGPSFQMNNLELLQKEHEENRNKLLRVLADFDNYKKRTAAEREQFSQFANELLIGELLPVMDGMARAFFAAEKAGAGEELIKGLALIKKQFEDILKKHGVNEVRTVGEPYNPHFHEAIMQKEHDGPAGMIIEEMQKGYTLQGRLIRPAMVIVSKHPK